MVAKEELRAFLRSRRARVTPQDAGLPVGTGPRRVPGLRREELALLAGVSVDYYTRLEQGRDLNVSTEVLDAIADALRLDDVERSHLRHLAQPTRQARRAAAPPRQQVRSGVRQLLDSLSTPGFVIGRRSDVLATNRLARALLTDFDALPVPQRNLVRWLCTDPAARELLLDWEEVAADAVAALHRQVGKDACDPVIAALVGELSVVSEEFARWWASQRVLSRTWALRRLHHPVVGRLDLAVEHLLVPGPEEQVLVVHSAEPGSASAEALALLASWTAPGAGRAPQERARDLAAGEA